MDLVVAHFFGRCRPPHARTSEQRSYQFALRDYDASRSFRFVAISSKCIADAMSETSRDQPIRILINALSSDALLILPFFVGESGSMSNSIRAFAATALPADAPMATIGPTVSATDGRRHSCPRDIVRSAAAPYPGVIQVVQCMLHVIARDSAHPLGLPAHADVPHRALIS
jgi:hypothetical protein